MPSPAVDQPVEDVNAPAPRAAADPSPAGPATAAIAPQSAPLRGQPLRHSMFLVTSAWVFGSVWANAVAGTPLTNYAKSLGASEFQFGVLAALPFLATLMSLPASILVERTGRRQRIFLWGAYINRILWIPIALVPWWMVQRWGIDNAAGHAMTVFLALLLMMHASGWVGSTAWASWMADLIPDRIRGRYFSRRRQWALLSAIPAALLAGVALDWFANTGGALRMIQWCAYIYIVAAIFGIIDITHFHRVPEIPKTPQRDGSVFAAWRQPLRDPQFLWFAGFVATLMFAIVFMGQFVTLYILQQLATTADGQPAAGSNWLTQMMLLVAPCLAQLFVFGIWGRAADRMGKRPLLVIAGLGLVPVAIGWCFVTRETIWLGYLLSIAGGALWPGIEIANFNLILEMSGSNNANANESGASRGSSGYFAVNSVIINLAGCAGGLSAGLIAQTLQNHGWSWQTSYKTFTYYEVLFVLSAILRLLAVVVFVPRLAEPEARPAREALRFMTANIYNNLFNAALQPLRFMGLSRKESYLEAEEIHPPKFGKK